MVKQISIEKENQSISEAALSTFGALARSNNEIRPELYKQYNVKRGLRNEDGTGVLVNLTTVGEVHGYYIDENEKMPIEGTLRYRGYEIHELIDGFRKENRFGYPEICYLLMFGQLPTQDQLDSMIDIINSYRELPKGFAEDMILKCPSPNIMNKMARSTLVSYSYDARADDTSVENVIRQCLLLISRFPSFAAYGYQALSHYFEKQSLFLHSPDPSLTTAENLLRMTRPSGKFTEMEARILDLCLVLHAEHGSGNNSAFAVRVISSTGTDTYSSISAALGSLKGPLHGGANHHVLAMMEAIKRDEPDWRTDAGVTRYLEAIVDKQAFDGKGLIYGMGHAVYTLSDPRTGILKEWARELAETHDGMADYELVEAIERLAPGVMERKRGRIAPLCANVDLYSGLVYSMLDIPVSLYTPIFAIGRLPGWCAHRIEQLCGDSKIIRPAGKNVKGRATYVPMSERSAGARPVSIPKGQA